MAFSATEKSSICKILGVARFWLNTHLASFATYISSDDEDAVRDELDRWDAGAGADFVAVEANNANFGAVIDPELERNDIRRNIRSILSISEDTGTSGGGSIDSFEIVRG